MDDLKKEFDKLIAAARSGDFAAAIRDSKLREAEVQRHPLNFLAARVQDESGFALRLHLFDARFQFKQVGLEVHDHAFDYESFVVDGAVEQTIYEAIPDPRGDHEFLDVTYGHGGSALRSSGRHLRLLQKRRETYGAGTLYKLSHGILHRLDLSGASATTLVLTRDRGGRPVTIRRSADERPPSTPRTPVRDFEGNLVAIGTHSLSQIVDLALSADQTNTDRA